MQNCSYRRLEVDENKQSKHGVCSLFLQSWLTPVMKKGNKSPLEFNDLVDFPGNIPAKELTNRIEILWRNETLKSDSPKLWLALFKLVAKRDLAFCILTYMLYSCCRIAKPVFLYFLLTEMNLKKRTYPAYLYAVGLTCSLVVELFLKSHYFLRAYLVAAQVRSALIALVYKKILVMKESVLAEFTSGQVINMVSKDLLPIVFVIRLLVIIAMVPLDFLLVSVLIWYFIGPEPLVGVAVLLISLAMQIVVGTRFHTLRGRIVRFTDQRLRLLSDIVSGIRVIKCNVWETLFQHLAEEIRRKEMNQIRKEAVIFSAVMSLISVVSVLSTFAALVTMVTTGHHLTAPLIFTTYLLMSTLRKSAMEFFASAVLNVPKSKVSFNRIQTFLMESSNISATATSNTCHCRNIDDSKNNFGSEGPYPIINSYYEVNLSDETNCYENLLLSLENVSCCHGDMTVLKNITLRLQGNDLVSVTGQVGSGKSSLLKTFCGEVTMTNGTACVTGQIAYVPQNAWLFSGTIRENILFGGSFNEKRYLHVLEACALTLDLEKLSEGDLTLIGERGVVLSGGQRARVSLARAVYAGYDIYLLDDPLSALDAKVSAHVFDECICGLLTEKMRVFVTHDIQQLVRADLVIVMQGGMITSKGRCFESVESNEYLAYLKSRGNRRMEEERVNQNEKADDELKLNLDYTASHETGETTEEDRDKGNVSFKTYWTFLRMGVHITVLILVLVVFLLAEGTLVVSTFWLPSWSKMSFDLQRSSISLSIYGSLVAGATFFAFVRAVSFMLLVLRSSELLHNRMLSSVLMAPIKFFDTTPAGRILNRFSSDVGCMDEQLPICLYKAFQMVLSYVVSLLVVSGVIYYINIATVPAFVLIFYLCRYGIKAIREIRRIEAISESPLFTHFTETMDGITTIRSHHKEDQFITVLHRHLDKCNRSLLAFMASERWLSFRCELICSVYSSCAVFATVVLGIEAATAGLVINYAIDLAVSLFGPILKAVHSESQMTSVQRVMTYAQLASEPGYSTGNDPPGKWPTRGRIQFKDTSLRYHSKGPNVLQNLSFCIESGEKIGIVGRTGAGKSSLIGALMRMPEHEGDIFIDDVSVGELNIKKSRAAVSVIFQNPFLFTGSLRFNLDPYEKHKDCEVWEALEAVQLKPLIEAEIGQLYCHVTENGCNFSLGERQLICLARAMLQKSKIIVLDEATASIDLKTEKLIHDTVRTKFGGCTVLTIAHRLDAITSHDRVLVLDGGKIVEYDEPRVLLMRSEGYLAKLCQAHAFKDGIS